jgi:hypothetical protein
MTRPEQRGRRALHVVEPSALFPTRNRAFPSTDRQHASDVRFGSFASDQTGSGFARCPLRAKNGQVGRHVAKSALCQHRPSATSFDDFVGAGEQRWRNFDAECLGGLAIDHKLELPHRGNSRAHRDALKLAGLRFTRSVGLAQTSHAAARA